MSARDEMIRKRAYELWEKAGMPQGRSEEFWFAARVEFETKAPPAEKQETAAPVPAPKPSPAPPAAKPAAKASAAARPGTRPKAKKT